MQSAGALLAGGATDDVLRVLRYLAVTRRQTATGRRTCGLDGTPYWNGIEMDRDLRKAPKFFRETWYGTKGDARAAESVIKCFRLRAASCWLISQHEVKPARLQLIDRAANLGLTTHNMDGLEK